MSGPEFTEVEEPFIDQLVRMGWKHTTGNFDDPSVTGRESFRDVFVTADLKKALRDINLNDSGEPWLDDDRISRALAALQRLGETKLLEANKKATDLIIRGTEVPGVEGWDGGRNQNVQFIDFTHPERNVFRVVNQFQVACPPGQAAKNIRPDLVLFVNGIPLVVVECKSPFSSEPIASAIDQLRRYSNRRRESGEVEINEGNEELFRYSQFLVATYRDGARAGTFSSQAVHYQEWKDTSPVPMADVAKELGRAGKPLNAQQKLVAGMLRPENLLDIVRHFTLFMDGGGRTVKVVCRYQQFRAVQLAVQRMLTGKTRAQDGEHDRRGGIVWHTQGSGKSLTMVFLIRKMRSDPKLTKFKIVVVTDRRDLEKQLSDTAALTDETLTRVKPKKLGEKIVSARDVLKTTLAKEGKDLVFTMVQKYRGDIIEDETEGDDDFDEGVQKPTKTEPLPELNTSENILVLVDEAHRSHTNAAHANLMAALPNCVKVGFTGTPIIMRDKGQTAKIFGEFIDRYTIRESEADKATVPILYEGRTAQAAVQGGGDLDEVFEDMLVDRSDEEKEAIKKKYATKSDVMEAPAMIAAKARNMLLHYVENILPNGFKAQVVAVSRRATIRYYEAFKAARDELVSEIESLHPNLLDLSEDALIKLDRKKALKIRAHRFLPTIKALEFAPVISSSHNDTVDPKGEWSTRAQVDARIERFKKPLLAGGINSFDHEKADPLSFLIVKSMLLTGFDAPIEQVLYLDRHIKEAELLQTIARVNRTYASGNVQKACGIVVDYYGVGNHLKQALQAYGAEDVDGALSSLKDEIPKLRDQHQRVIQVLTSRDMDALTDPEAAIEVLRDEKVRAEYQVKLKQFLSTLDTVLPRPEALPFVNDAKTLAHIQVRAKKRYRGDEIIIGKEVGEKVRVLIDEHVISLGIDPRVRPIEITSAEFEDHIDKEVSPRAKASEMEHALRYHIREHASEDPEHYEKLSERLRGIIQQFDGRWEEMCEALKDLVSEANRGRQAETSHGLDPETQAPFFDILKREAYGDEGLEGQKLDQLCASTVELVDHIKQEIGIEGFWKKPQAQQTLRGWVFGALDDTDVFEFEKLDSVTDRIMELAKANHRRLVGK
jgi:type I restriction enzyme R subunit